MNLEYIESIIIPAKENDRNSRELLFKEFEPYIKNYSRKISIQGYSSEDLENECSLALLNCLNKYNPGSNCFVKYAFKGIKNYIYSLIRKNKSLPVTLDDSTSALDHIEKTSSTSKADLEESILFNLDLEIIREALRILTSEELELFDYVFIKQHSLREYAKHINIPYSTIFPVYVSAKMKVQNYCYNHLQLNFLNED